MLQSPVLIASLRLEAATHFLRHFAGDGPWLLSSSGMLREFSARSAPAMLEWIGKQQLAQHGVYALPPSIGGALSHIVVCAPIEARSADMALPPSLAVAAHRLTLIWRLNDFPVKPATWKRIAGQLAREIGGAAAVGQPIPLPGTIEFRHVGARLTQRIPVQMLPPLDCAYRIADGVLAAPQASAPALTVRASEVEAKPIEWLWPGFITLGALTLLGGAEGMGKSQAALSIAATLSTGGTWPTGERAERGSAMVFEAEDDLERVVVPRLLAAGADLKRVAVGKLTDLSAGIDALAAEAKRLNDMRLIVLSPIRKFMGAAEDHGNLGVRKVLEPLLAWGEAQRIAILGIAHPPGAKKNQPAFAGSQAYVEVARGAFSVIADPSDRNPVLKQRRRFLVAAKSNLSSDQGTIPYRIEGVTVAGIDTSRVVWAAGEPIQPVKG